MRYLDIKKKNFNIKKKKSNGKKLNEDSPKH